MSPESTERVLYDHDHFDYFETSRPWGEEPYDVGEILPFEQRPDGLKDLARVRTYPMPSDEGFAPKSFLDFSGASCPNCKEPFVKYFYHEEGSLYIWGSTSQHVCHGCGFWFHHTQTDGDYHRETMAVGRLRKFDLADKEAPYRDLAEWLALHPDDVYYVNPHRFEHVVRDVMKNYMDCEFAVTVPSSDGGYDLLGYDTEHGKTLVEVKRYTKTRKVSVAAVRQLAGVMNREGASRGAIVATSDFTRGSHQEATAQRQEGANHQIEIELLKFDQLIDFLDVRRVPLSQEEGVLEYWDEKLRRLLTEKQRASSGRDKRYIF